MTPTFRTKAVTKKFKSVVALNEVSISIAPGEVVALLGHNGAGKTTLFRIALGFLPVDGGSVEILEHQPGSREARKAISYLPESVAFPKMLTGWEVVSYYATLKNAPVADVKSALENVDLADAANHRCGTYSKGMRQRLGLAQALVGNPKLMLLDEPTSGLDPISRQNFYEIISEISSRGTAVLLSSHSLSELEAKTDRVAILRQGELVADAPFAQLQKTANLPIRIRVSSTPDNVKNVHNRLGGQRLNGTLVEFTCAQSAKMQKLAAISDLGDGVLDVELSQPSLDEIYRHFSAQEKSGDAP